MIVKSWACMDLGVTVSEYSSTSIESSYGVLGSTWYIIIITQTRLLNRKIVFRKLFYSNSSICVFCYPEDIFAASHSIFIFVEICSRKSPVLCINEWQQHREVKLMHCAMSIQASNHAMPFTSSSSNRSSSSFSASAPSFHPVPACTSAAIALRPAPA